MVLRRGPNGEGWSEPEKEEGLTKLPLVSACMFNLLQTTPPPERIWEALSPKTLNPNPSTFVGFSVEEFLGGRVAEVEKVEAWLQVAWVSWRFGLYPSIGASP